MELASYLAMFPFWKRKSQYVSDRTAPLDHFFPSSLANCKLWLCSSPGVSCFADNSWENRAYNFPEVFFFFFLINDWHLIDPFSFHLWLSQKNWRECNSQENHFQIIQTFCKIWFFCFSRLWMFSLGCLGYKRSTQILLLSDPPNSLGKWQPLANVSKETSYRFYPLIPGVFHYQIHYRNKSPLLWALKQWNWGTTTKNSWYVV